MRKRIFPRIVWFLFLNCVVFVLLVSMQFTRRGNFSQKIGDMLVSGRYLGTAEVTERRSVDGGARVVFEGLEFRLDSSEYITVRQNGVTFILSGGTELSFINPAPDTPELQISGKFPHDDSSVKIPFKTRRSTIVRGTGNNAFSVLHNGRYYQFNRPLSGIESGHLTLLAAMPSVSYRMTAGKTEFNPVDFTLPQAETAQVFSGELSRWINYQFGLWEQMGLQTDEDTVIAWCGESVRKGSYRSAVSVVPVSFSTDPGRTWESAVYQFDRRIGVWERAARNADISEREKINRIGRLLTEKENRLLVESHLIEFLAVRNYNQQLNDFLSFTGGIEPSDITLEMIPGILENYLDLQKWRSGAANPFESLVDPACRLVVDGLQRKGDQVFVFSGGSANTEFNLRLGLALYKWGEQSGKDEWAGVGRSLVFSVIALNGSSSAIPALLTIGETASSGGAFIPSAEQISSAKLYRVLNDSEYLPHATVTGTSGIWAWTAAESVNVTRNGNQMDIAIRFPVGTTHYVMLRNVPPFALLQIYEMNWRRAVDFESYYDSSGWYYFEQEQILVLKINHRSSVENIRIFFTAPRVEAPPPSPSPPPEEQGEQ
jgi:hypothetical protein